MIKKRPLLSLCSGLILLAASSAHADIDLTLFDSNAMVSSPAFVTCTLSTGETAQCAEFVVKYIPDDLPTGPYCPETLNDAGGIWAWDGEEAGLYRLDGEFFEMLAELGLNFSDDGEHINLADPGAGPPASDHACLEAKEQATVQMTLRIPVSPTMAQSPTDLGTVAKVGLALDGVPVFADAPSVLETGHLPALDTCGGHIDPGGWYHWHATATDIDAVFDDRHVDADCGLPQSSSAMFGYAFDGHAMYGSADSDGSIPTDLDECNGHVSVTEHDAEGEYHYHATSQFPNLPACLSGVLVNDNFSTTAAAGIGSATGRGGHGDKGAPGGRGMPDFSATATALGISEGQLMAAMNAAGGPGPHTDMATLATSLGVSQAVLQKALPQRPGR